MKNVGALTCLYINGFLDPYLYQSHRCKPLIYWPFSASSALIGWTPQQSLHLLDLLYWWRSLINAAHQQIRRDLKPLTSSNNQALEKRIVQQPFLSEFVTSNTVGYCLFFYSLSVEAQVKKEARPCSTTSRTSTSFSFNLIFVDAEPKEPKSPSLGYLSSGSFEPSSFVFLGPCKELPLPFFRPSGLYSIGCCLVYFSLASQRISLVAALWRKKEKGGWTIAESC